MDEQGIQTHGVASGSVIDDLISGNESSIICDLKQPVILHAGGAADPLRFLYISDTLVTYIFDVMRINVSGDQGI